MTADIAKKNPERRDYRDASGKRLPSVTTIIGGNLGWSKDGLIGWAYRKGIDAMREEVDGCVGHRFHAEDVERCATNARDKRAHQKQRDAAADAGTLAHSFIEAHLKNETVVTADVPTETLDLARAAFARWLRWYLAVDPVLITAETLMVDRELGFGGTLDAVLRISGKIVLADWKTGKGAYDDTVIQVGAYEHLWSLRGEQPIDDALIVNAPTGGELVVHEISREQLDLGRDAFMGLLEIHKTRSRMALKEIR